MTDNIVSSVVTIATAIVGVAILATLVSKNASTAQVIQAATSGFASDLTAAEGPVSGSSGLSFGGGGASSLNLF